MAIKVKNFVETDEWCRVQVVTSNRDLAIKTVMEKYNVKRSKITGAWLGRGAYRSSYYWVTWKK